jgi:23S rRNA pseudouridine1911/1915/1917 synthase
LPESKASEASRSFEVSEEQASQRLDRWLAGEIPELSRARIQGLIKNGHVRKAGETIGDGNVRVKPGEVYEVRVPDAEPSGIPAQALPLDIVYEDASVIVIDKPPGLVVHPAAGHADGTLVNALVAHCGDSLAGVGGVKRPGIVHRLDKDTSGLLVIAKTDAAHQSLSDQFRAHGADGRLHRAYLALVWGRPLRSKGTIDVPLGRSAANRTKISVSKRETARHAVTHYEVVEIFEGSKPAATVSLVRLTLETGRTHQIRVHLAHIGHPVLGDPVYGIGFKTREAALDERTRECVSLLRRQALHASELRFEHPESGHMLSFESSLPLDISHIIYALRRGPEKPSGRRANAPPTGKSGAKRSY